LAIPRDARACRGDDPQGQGVTGCGQTLGGNARREKRLPVEAVPAKPRSGALKAKTRGAKVLDADKDRSIV
jgi:hypothetical protein